jgi:hypothetical protein
MSKLRQIDIVGEKIILSVDNCNDDNISTD